jgi:predicted permease
LTQASCLQGLLIKIAIAIISDLRHFIVIIGVLLIGFSAGFAVSMPDNPTFDNRDGMVITSGMFTSYLAMLGVFDIEDYTNAESTMFFAIFLFLIVIIMLNLLIAIMTDTYERVKESCQFEGRKMRIETIIEQELLINDSQNAKFFPEYLQVLQPVQKATDEWAGVSGQISTVRDEVTVVTQELVRVEQKVDAMTVSLKTIVEQLQNTVQQKVDPQ